MTQRDTDDITLAGLSVVGLSKAFKKRKVLTNISMRLNRGEVVALLGPNGAGKTTTLKTIMGLLPLSSGKITLNGTDLSSIAPHKISQQGIAYVPQGRRLFSELSVAQNLEVGLLHTPDKAQNREELLTLFPRLRDRLKQQANTLSGGEQQIDRKRVV